MAMSLPLGWQLTDLVKLQPPARTFLVAIVLAGIIWIQAPFIIKMITQDRQNYREAICYMEHRIKNPRQKFVFTVGYAGDHFNYYAQDTVFVPVTFGDFMDRSNGKKYLWCLITA